MKITSWIRRVCKFASYDMNYWIEPSGVLHPAPNWSHSAVARDIIKERDDRNMDPSAAYEQLLDEDWIWVSGSMFQVKDEDGRKNSLIRKFIRQHPEYYDQQGKIEIDDRHGEDRMFNVNDYLNGDVGAAGRWSEVPVGGYNPTHPYYRRHGD